MDLTVSKIVTNIQSMKSLKETNTLKAFLIELNLIIAALL